MLPALLLAPAGALADVLPEPGHATAGVFIPPDEHVAYVDAAGAYTVVGNVKNGLDVAVIPTITVRVQDGPNTLTSTIRHVPLPPGSEIPFKAKFPDAESPVLLPATLDYEITEKDPVPLQVIYDETLVQHEDGHLTGRVQNTGAHTIHNPKIFAVVHGHDRVLDVAQNLGQIASLEPGEVASFAMYPDPSITDDISYYSCFGPVDSTVVPVRAEKNGGKFDFRYDSGAWYYGAEFDEAGTSMTITGYNSYPLETYANFEFAPISGDEVFSVTIDGEPAEFVQSIDELGFWHVAYSVEPHSQQVVRISGFEPGLPPDSAIPAWIREAAALWSDGGATDEEFARALKYMIVQGIADAPAAAQSGTAKIPAWFAGMAGWWSEGLVSDPDFAGLVGWLARNGHLTV